MTEAFVVVDLEGTSIEPKETHVVEWACVIVRPAWFNATENLVNVMTGLVRPPIPIPAQTSAVHQIVDADVEGAPTWDSASHILRQQLEQAGRIVVAHSVEYERTVLDPERRLRWLCTYKAALRVWPEAPSHSNECLRYFLGHGTGRAQRQAPHSALHDAQVTAQILNSLLATGIRIDDMVRWTDEPALLPRCPIGDYRGMPWADVPADFLYWIVSKAATMRADTLFCAETELKRRQEEAQETARAARIAACDDDDDIPF